MRLGRIQIVDAYVFSNYEYRGLTGLSKFTSSLLRSSSYKRS